MRKEVSLAEPPEKKPYYHLRPAGADRFEPVNRAPGSAKPRRYLIPQPIKMSLRPEPKRRLPRAALILAAAIVAVLAQTVAACQPPPAPDPTATPSPFAPPSPPPFSAPAPADTPASAMPTLTPDAPAATVPPTPTPTTIPAALAPPSPPALPTPTPTSPPTPDVPVSTTAVPYTDGPVSAVIMPSRDHFARPRRIAEIVPGGYSTVPPTSGRHWDAWAACGFYDYALPDELLVHNLEHGNIIISHNLPDAAQIAALRAAVADIPLASDFAIIRPYPALPEGMVALTAWGALDRMPGVNPQRIARFFDQYPGTAGPEFANGLPCTTGISMPMPQQVG